MRAFPTASKQASGTCLRWLAAISLTRVATASGLASVLPSSAVMRAIRG